jgi:hypothetical protein
VFVGATANLFFHHEEANQKIANPKAFFVVDQQLGRDWQGTNL